MTPETHTTTSEAETIAVARALAARLRPGDVALTHGSRHYTVADDPATRPALLILPRHRRYSRDGQAPQAPPSPGARPWRRSLTYASAPW